MYKSGNSALTAGNDQQLVFSANCLIVEVCDGVIVFDFMNCHNWKVPEFLNNSKQYTRSFC
jgi:hypothetical protein